MATISKTFPILLLTERFFLRFLRFFGFPEEDGRRVPFRWMPPAVGCQRLWDKIHSHRRGHAKTQVSVLAVCLLHPSVQKHLILLHGDSGAAQHLPGSGQVQLFVFVVEQLDPALLLQPADVLGYSRLGQVELLCRAGVVHQPTDLQKGVDSKIQHSSSSYP